MTCSKHPHLISAPLVLRVCRVEDVQGSKAKAAADTSSKMHALARTVSLKMSVELSVAATDNRELDAKICHVCKLIRL